MQLLSNLTALVAAATTLSILDYSQQNAIDLSNGQQNCADFTAVQTWPYAANNENQRVCLLSILPLNCTLTTVQWTMLGGPDTYQIQSPECGLYLTYPGVESSALAQRAPLTSHSNFSSSWTISLVNPSVPTGPWK